MNLRYSIALLLSALIFPKRSTANDLFGLHKSIYNPRCAHACRETIAVSPLKCTSNTTHQTSPECFASDEAFLQTLAYCISTHCQEKQDGLDAYWQTYVAGWKLSTPKPKYNYTSAVQRAGRPKDTLSRGKALDRAYKVDDDAHATVDQALWSWSTAEGRHAKFALATFIIGFAVPIVLSLLRYMPYSGPIASKFRSVFVYPTVWSHQWSMQIREAGDISPTRGQALFILYIIIINAVFAGIGHFQGSSQGFSFNTRHGQLIACVANRFGALALANLPLLFLYPGRNNILLRVTNWSHTTFIMLHRWLGYVVVAETILHSILYLQLAVRQHMHTSWSHVPAWQYGSLATVAMSIIPILAIVYIRQRVYELFLLVHIIFASLVVVGAFLHIHRLFNTSSSGWILYLWLCVLFWSYDRILRLVRLLSNGVQKATITIIDDEHIRVDIPKAKGIGYAYLYFPTLTVRFWENHPFSIATSNPRIFTETVSKLHQRMIRKPKVPQNTPIKLDTLNTNLYYPGGSGGRSVHSQFGPTSPASGKSPVSPFTPMSAFPTFSPLAESVGSPFSTASNMTYWPWLPPKTPRPKGLTFFMRTHGGMTQLLRKRKTLPVLVESSYGKPKDMSMYPVMICVAGGVGITAILPYLHSHKGTTRLYWGSRSKALVNAVQEEIRGYNGEVSVGRRIFINVALQREFDRVDGGTPIAVVVSGPKQMCEDVRAYCCDIAKKRRGEVKLLDENFNW